MLEFVKMHALQNDYVLFDIIKHPEYERLLTSDFIKYICNRHKGIGADGVLLVLKNLVFRMFNPDGTEAEACANGLRVYALYAYQQGYTKNEQFRVKLFMTQEYVDLAVNADENLVSLSLNNVEHKKNLRVNGATAFVFAVPNPHIVVFVDRKVFNSDDIFRTFDGYDNYNVNVAYLEKHTLLLRTRERGAGETLSCGTGAIASSVASYIKTSRSEFTVKMRGGTAQTTVSQVQGNIYSVSISSKVSTVYYGKII